MKKYYSMVTTIVHYLFYGLFFLTPLVMNSKTSEIFEFNKMMFIYLVAILAGTLWLASYFLDYKKHIYKPYFLLALLLFLVTQMISAYYSIDPHTSLYGYYGRWNGGIVSIIAYIVLFFVFVQIFTRKTLNFFLQVSLAGSLMVIIWGLLAKIGLDFSCLIFTGSLNNICWTAQFQPSIRMFSTVGQPNWLGAYLCITFFIGLYFFMKEYLKDRWQSLQIYGYGSYLVLNALSIYFTKSRSALLALGVAFCLGIALILLRKVKPLYTALGIMILCGFLFLLNPQNILSQVQAPPPDDLNVTDSFDIRKIVWQGAIDLGLRYPYFGTGVETFAYSYYFTRPPEHNRTSEWDFIYNKAHNEYLNYFATTGFVGLAAYLLLILLTTVLFYVLYKKYLKKDSSSLLGSAPLYIYLSYVTILITNFFGFSTSTSQLFFYILPGVLLIDAGMNRVEMVEKAVTAAQSMRTMAAGLVLSGVIAFSGIIFVYHYYHADLAYNTAKGFLASNDYGQAMVYLHDALQMKDEHVYEDKLSSSLAYLAFQSSFDDKKQSNDFIELSKYSNYKTLSASPYNMLYWKTQARNYYLYYQITQDEEDMQNAIAAMEKALKIAPTDVQTMYALAVLYVTAGQEAKDMKVAALWKEKARAALKNIFELKPDYREAQQLGGEV